MDVYTLKAGDLAKYFKGNIVVDSGVMGPCITVFGLGSNELTAKHFLIPEIKTSFEKFIYGSIDKIGDNTFFYIAGNSLITRDQYSQSSKNLDQKRLIKYYHFIQKQEEAIDIVEETLNNQKIINPKLEEIIRWSPSGVGSRMITNNGQVNLMWFKNKKMIYNGQIEEAPLKEEYYKILN